MKNIPSYRSELKGKKFLGVKFIKCHCYGRLYQNNDGTAYVGHCPKCYTAFHVRIGEAGTSKRLFAAMCR